MQLRILGHIIELSICDSPTTIRELLRSSSTAMAFYRMVEASVKSILLSGVIPMEAQLKETNSDTGHTYTVDRTASQSDSTVGFSVYNALGNRTGFVLMKFDMPSPMDRALVEGECLIGTDKDKQHFLEIGCHFVVATGAESLFANSTDDVKQAIAGKMLSAPALDARMYQIATPAGDTIKFKVLGTAKESFMTHIAYFDTPDGVHLLHNKEFVDDGTANGKGLTELFALTMAAKTSLGQVSALLYIKSFNFDFPVWELYHARTANDITKLADSIEKRAVELKD